MPPERVERKLAAILAADVAGYSRLMSVDEESTVARLKSHRRELIDPKIGEHRGRIVKTTGDGILIEFPSVVDAVRCAVEVQRGMAERNASEMPEKPIEYRVGINVGDILIDGDDILGDGVNVAAMRIAAASNAFAGRLGEARQFIARARELDPGLRLSTLKDRVTALPPDRFTKYVEALRKAGLPE